MADQKPTVAVYKFSSCDGCQLSILNMEDELLDLVNVIEIAYFLEATRAQKPGPYDIAFVEGSVTTQHEIERIKEIRTQAKTLIALGTCATAGGIQALRNFADADDFAGVVYPRPDYLQYLKTSTPFSEHVHVDMELWGCPVNKAQVLEIIVALLNQRKPNLPPYSVCLECKHRNTICVLVDKGTPCLGPGTRAGCGAICPAYGRGCYGCFGPFNDGNMTSLSDTLQMLERYPGETKRLFRGVSGYAPAFQRTANTLAANEETK